MDVGEVVEAHSELELSERLDERHPLNVTDGATKLEEKWRKQLERETVQWL